MQTRPMITATLMLTSALVTPQLFAKEIGGLVTAEAAAGAVAGPPIPLTSKAAMFLCLVGGRRKLS